MDFQAAADLVAALRPFTRSTRSSHLEGIERLVRAASSVTGELHEVRRLMPARAVRSRPDGSGIVSVEPTDPGGGPGNSDDLGAAVSTGPGESGDLFRGATSRSGGSIAASPALILLLLLILLLDSR